MQWGQLVSLQINTEISGMLTLVIQTVINRIDIALLRDDILLAHESWVSEKDEVKKVVPALESVFKKSGFVWADLSQIVVVVGKGNFSSTRIGVTIGNILGMATEAQIFELEMEGDFDLGKLLECVENKFKEGWEPSPLAKPVYRSEPMISPSKKKNFTN